MRSPWPYILMAAALVAASLPLVACGGEEEPELDQYLQRLQDIRDGTEMRMSTLTEKSQEVGKDIDATRDYYDSVEGILRQNLNDLTGVRPPTEAQDAHEELLTALAERLGEWEDFTDRAADFKLLHALEAMKRELDKSLETVEERISDACLQLQAVADENGIDVDLECE